MIAPALALAAVWLVATTVGPTSLEEPTDVPLYLHFASLVWDGAVPYRDFALEYPPLALAPMVLAALPSLDLDTFEATFGALMLASALVVQREAARLAGGAGRSPDGTRGRRPEAAGHPAGEWPGAGGHPGRAVAWALVLLPLAAGAIVRTRFDLAAVALALLGLRLVAEGRRSTLGFVVLALATATKLFPAVLAAVALAWLWGRGERHAVRAGAAAFAVTLVVVCAPFVAASPDGFADQARFHLERPVQVESSPASILWAVGGSGVTPTAERPDRFRSHGLAGGGADAVAFAFLLLQVAALAAVLVATARRPGSLVPAALAALLAFVALGKVLSPQFLLWLAPLAVVARAQGVRAPATLVLGAVVVTQLWFPARYDELVAGDRRELLLLALRNVALLGALSLLLVRDAAPARWRRPVAAPSSG